MMQKFIAYLFLATLSFTGLHGMQSAPQKTTKEQTLSIIKPDAVKSNHTGEILARFEKNGLRIAGMKMTKLTQNQAKQFYKEHTGKPFFEDLTTFISSGPIVALVLEGDGAIMKNRELMGATDPSQAKSGTIRKDFAESKQRNAVHGSDSKEAALREITFFFKPDEVY